MTKEKRNNLILWLTPVVVTFAVLLIVYFYNTTTKATLMKEAYDKPIALVEGSERTSYLYKNFLENVKYDDGKWTVTVSNQSFYKLNKDRTDEPVQYYITPELTVERKTNGKKPTIDKSKFEYALADSLDRGNTEIHLEDLYKETELQIELKQELEKFVEQNMKPVEDRETKKVLIDEINSKLHKAGDKAIDWTKEAWKFIKDTAPKIKTTIKSKLGDK